LAGFGSVDDMTVPFGQMRSDTPFGGQFPKGAIEAERGSASFVPAEA
jgi:hypothetical protein